MDSKEYDKIVDKLMQFRSRIPLSMHLSDDRAKVAALNLRMTIDDLLSAIDEYAEFDILGWIK